MARRRGGYPTVIMALVAGHYLFLMLAALCADRGKETLPALMTALVSALVNALVNVSG